jgi:hypothetical protein
MYEGFYDNKKITMQHVHGSEQKTGCSVVMAGWGRAGCCFKKPFLLKKHNLISNPSR